MLKVEENRTAFDPVRAASLARYPSGTDLTFPVQRATATTIMDNTRWIYDTPVSSDYSRWFEVHVHIRLQSFHHEPLNSEWLFTVFMADRYAALVVLADRPA